MSELARDYGLLSDEKYSRYCDKKEAVAKLRSEAASRSLTRDAEVGADQLSGEVLAQKAKIAELTRRPKVKLAGLLDAAGISAADDVIEQVEIELKYQGYIDRQQAEVEKLKSQQALEIPAAIDFDDIRGSRTKSNKSWMLSGLKILVRRAGFLG